MGNRRLLLVMPEGEAAKDTRWRLEQAGFEVGWTSSGSQAWQLIEQGGWEFVLCSNELPGDECREVCELLHEFAADPPKIVLLVPSGEPDPEAERQKLGADAVLRLPLNLDGLRQQMRLVDLCRELTLKLEALREENRLLNERLTQTRSPPEGRLVRFELFRSVLVAEVKKAQRYGYPLSLLVLAVDGYRDLAGWLSPGQRKQYFERFFEVLARSTREIDIAVMFAEDKLLVLMPHTPVEGAAVVADRMRARVAASKPPASLRQLRVTVSVSVAATGGGDQIMFGEMVGRAMRGLQEAEQKGGDVVIVCRSSEAAHSSQDPAAKDGQLGPRIFFL